MGKKEKLYHKATASPQNLNFDDLCALAEAVGFIFRRQQGSHKLYKNIGYQKMMNFQPDKKNKSKAKKYQVFQLLNFIDEHFLME